MTPDVTFATPADLVTYINANIKNRVGSDVIIPQEHNNIENGIVSFLGYTFPILYADLVTTIAGGTLITNGTYNITDRGIYLKATSTTTISSIGFRVMMCPAYYATGADTHGNTWIGIWRSTKTANSDDLAIWGGLVWKNLTGAIGTATDQTALDGTNWVVVSKTAFTNTEYIEMVFGCGYDVAHDFVTAQWDGNNNHVGIPFPLVPTPTQGVNVCDITDWNFNTSGYLMYDNIVEEGIYNNDSNEEIFSNICSGGIYNNFCVGIQKNICPWGINGNVVGDSIEENKVQYIVNNVGGAISNNTNNGNISGNIYEGVITKNSNNGSIFDNVGLGIISDNTCRGDISTNTMVGADIIGNTNAGGITDNLDPVEDISQNSNNGDISGNSCEGEIFQNSNNGSIFDNANLGRIRDNTCGGDIKNFPGGQTYDIRNNNFNADMDGVFITNNVITIVNDINGSIPTPVTAATYDLLPWDSNVKYTNAGDCTVTVYDGMGLLHSSIHTHLNAFDIIFTTSGGAVINNAAGDTKSNGQYAVAALVMVGTNILILSGNTQP